MQIKRDPIQLPKLGTQVGDGKYAGILTDDNGQPYVLVLLDARPVKRLNWSEAQSWAEGLGAFVPNRVESAHLYRVLRGQFQADWYWTSESYSESYAWFQNFYYGLQDFNLKSGEGLAVAVRRLDLESFDPFESRADQAATAT